ncbi:PAS domain S-box protein [Aquamicrobium sp. LC103]|uniref:PAS domain S-box protein n=1 Tax=Aquamicrobium sp. LC103 TaxID=1120658 RepID=UPI00063E7361|nr:PAS domain S-box protein [Aquamicrobium sp. LC103]TKT74135.1 PAS domain S-box protein [Aquamicrobium sp. LC103]
MAPGPYSFIDIAVLEEVRARFAEGDALAILSTDLDHVVWANGPGAALFGYPDIEAIMGASAGLGLPARRQISSVSGFPELGRDRSVTVRLASGLSSRAISILVSGIGLPDGEPAILLAVPAKMSSARGAGEIAARAVSGFTEAGYFAALLDEEGAVEAASEGFAELAVSEMTRRRLVTEVRGETDRLVKRPIEAGDGMIPAGIARLTDMPAKHLLVVINEKVSAVEPPPADLPTSGETGSGAELTPTSQPGTSAATPKPTAQNTHSEDRWYFHGDTIGERQRQPAKAAAVRPVSHPETIPASRPEATPEAKPDHAAAPVRFVWRTDAEGRFSTISEEFVEAVGAGAADIIGRKFGDVANVFGLDPEREIAGLLERRDTWSGRSVLWPVTGTALRVPVDLAALPVYNRDRDFEGFRGFGVARMADAVADPEALGLSLATPGETADEPPAEDASDEEPAFLEAPAETVDGDPPLTNEVPAIAIDAEQEHRLSDKVIRLAEHRSNGPDKSLTAGERNALEEIRARLRRDFETTGEEPESAAPTVFGKRKSRPAVEDDSEPANAVQSAPTDEQSPTKEEQEAGTASESVAPSGSAPEEAREAEPASATDPAEAGGTEAVVAIRQAVEAPEIATAGFLPSAFSARPEADRQEIDTGILAGLPLAVLIHAGDALYYANPEFLTLTGYASLHQIQREGGLGRLFVDCDPDSAAAGPEARKLRMRALGGDEFPVEAHLQSIAWNGGKALLLAVHRPPIDKPALAAQLPAPAMPEAADTSELERRVAEMRAIIDTATDGVVLIDKDGTIRNISHPAEALFGFDSAQVEGKPFTSLFAIESQRSARDYLSGLSENGVASVLNDGREVIGREAEGRFIPLFMTIGRLPGDSGFCAVVRDITQWKRAEEELTQARAQAERSSSQKTEFLARVSHEIRTPLNAIIGFSELMMDEKFGPIGSDRYRDYLRDINRSGNHVLDLVNDLLDISKIEAGEQEMNYEAVSLNDTLGETVAMMQPQANRERVIIRSSLSSRLPEVVADLRSVRQIALNLLSNAVRYTQAGGQVIVSTSYEASGDIVMRVRDTGIGMTLSEIDQALKPFKQINALKRGRNDGTGLGLPLTKAMVEANRARFSISSTPGEGTLVEITFPSTRVLAD